MASPVPRPITAETAKAETVTSGGRPRGTEDLEETLGATQEPDPYNLSQGRKTDTELSSLRQRSKKGRKVADYHAEQNELIDMLLMPMEQHTANAQAAEEAARLPVKIAIYASFVANVALSILQLYAAISSGSLSFLATAMDSIFDPGSNLILGWLHRKSKKLDINKWPVGGTRLETVGNIVYGFLMATVNVVVIVEAIRALVSHKGDELNKFHIPAVVSVGAALFVKFLLFLYCFGIRKHSSQVQVLWEDHRNDIVLNSFALLMSSGGSNWKWFLDPMGGLLIALGTTLAWTHTIWGEFELLTGKAAPHEFTQVVIYKTMTFAPEITAVDTARVYHSGPGWIIEVDVVMDPNLSLRRAHDISQLLQDKLELLPNVERAYVHVDYEWTHAPEHRKRKAH
ncbi:CDF-like metal transporter [Auriculariales sp. MPI-PUGE-AT-0066]|nr:CDF-like metal transporter [Auriculariales sp. MPI-PUGE-AT-0066]